MRKIESCIASLLILCSLNLNASVSKPTVEKAVELYNCGLYSQSMNILQNLPEFGKDPVVDGYFLLCSFKLHTVGYEHFTEDYIAKYRTNPIADEICILQAYDCFDKLQFGEALKYFNMLHYDSLPEKARAEFAFKKGYSYYMTGNIDEARLEYYKVLSLPFSEYTGAAKFNSAYILYEKGDIEVALDLFEDVKNDERFRSIANFYIIMTRFEVGDLDYVLDQGVKLYNGEGKSQKLENFPSDRKEHVARIISEAYLIKGDIENANKFYKVSDASARDSKENFYFSGNLLYNSGDYTGAIENFSKIEDKSDSLGQIAHYKTAIAYMNLGKKHDAIDSFKAAAMLSYDSTIQEDSWFNYAKLAFDCYNDTSGFKKYMSLYSNKWRGDMIYNYIALAEMENRNYAAVIDAYSNLEVEDDNRENLVKAYYLHAAELMRKNNRSAAIECLHYATLYSESSELIHQLSLFYLADCLFQNKDYSHAIEKYKALYDSGALMTQPQGKLIPYYLAYSYLNAGDYDKAEHYFEKYLKSNDNVYGYQKDAMLRKADAQFMGRKYNDAALNYKYVAEQYKDVNDIYPYYQSAMAFGMAKKASDKLKMLSTVKTARPDARYYSRALFELGKVQQEKKLSSEALSTFMYLVSTAKDGEADKYIASSYLEIGAINNSLGYKDLALENFKKIIEKSKTDPAYLEYYDYAMQAIESVYGIKYQDQYLAFKNSLGREGNMSEMDIQTAAFQSAFDKWISDDIEQAYEGFKYFKNKYPNSELCPRADYYLGEYHNKMHDYEQACAFYKSAMTGFGDYAGDAMLKYADLSLQMANYQEAYGTFQSVFNSDAYPVNKTAALLGVVKSAYEIKKYEEASNKADAILLSDDYSDDTKRAVRLIKAKSLLSMSEREKALPHFEILSKKTATAEGSEAYYYLVKDAYDRADYTALLNKAIGFSNSDAPDMYFLAKSFILLADGYVKQGNVKQAIATYNSIKESDDFPGKSELVKDIDDKLKKLR